MKVYLSNEGMERRALGRSVYTWDYVVRFDDDPVPEYCCLVAAFEPDLPNPVDCVAPVMARLKERENVIQADAQKDLMGIQERRMNLQAITFEMVVV